MCVFIQLVHSTRRAAANLMNLLRRISSYFDYPQKRCPTRLMAKAKRIVDYAYYLSQIKWACKNFAWAHKYFSIHS